MSGRHLNLPGGAVTLEAGAPAEASKGWNRDVYAAAHVVADPLAAADPSEAVSIDWDRTLAYREHLWSLGFGVAEAMDTAQRGMGLDWPTSLDLIRRATAAARAGGHKIASGAGTDHLAPGDGVTLEQVIAAYEEQCEAVEAAGSRVILMASRALVRAAKGPDDYLRVYERVLSGLAQPAILHWLGEMFDPALEGYWGHADHMAAMETALQAIEASRDRIAGIKISLLSAEKEVAMRRRLPEGVTMYTGDDFNYPELIEGDAQGHSDALLGIFDPIAVPAGRAFNRLGAGDTAGFREILAPTLPLSRHVFRAPTRFYKTGVVFLAWLNGHQPGLTMVGGQESARSTQHFAELIRLANAAGVLANPDLAATRARAFFATRGVDV